jgi:hypothetical protein
LNIDLFGKEFSLYHTAKLNNEDLNLFTGIESFTNKSLGYPGTRVMENEGKQRSHTELLTECVASGMKPNGGTE